MSEEILDNYIIYKNYKSILGKGSYSTVFKGKYTGITNKYLNNDDTVAVKVVSIYNLGLKDRENINNEIFIMNVMKNNNHPNIIRCYDTVETENYTYIIMELCDQGDLVSIMGKPIEESVVKSYFIQLIEGLKFLKQFKIIHRDLKPSNILLTNNKKTIKIADFGFAKINENLFKNSVCGSPLYMAPEIMNNDIYSDQSDLWSVGMILYEMLYGIHPYKDCVTMFDLKSVVNNGSISIPPINCSVNITNNCMVLLKKLLQKNTLTRISWDDFFNNNWSNDNGKVDIKQTKSINIGSVGSRKSSCSSFSYNTPESLGKGITINIIENYYTSSSENSPNSKNSPNIKNTDSFTNSCMFEMEIDNKK